MVEMNNEFLERLKKTSPTQYQTIMKNLNNQQYIKTKEEVREQTVAIQNSSLLEVKGLGPKTVATLMEH